MLKYYALFFIIMTVIGLTIGFIDSIRKNILDDFIKDLKSFIHMWKVILILFIVAVGFILAIKFTISIIGVGFIIFIIVFILIFG